MKKAAFCAELMKGGCCELSPDKWVVRKPLVPILPKFAALLIQDACLTGIARELVEVPEIPVDPGYAIGVTQVGLRLRIRCLDLFQKFFVDSNGSGRLAGIGVVLCPRTQSGIDRVAKSNARCRIVVKAAQNLECRIDSLPGFVVTAEEPQGVR